MIPGTIKRMKPATVAKPTRIEAPMYAPSPSGRKSIETSGCRPSATASVARITPMASTAFTTKLTSWARMKPTPMPYLVVPDVKWRRGKALPIAEAMPPNTAPITKARNVIRSSMPRFCQYLFQP